MDSLPDIVGRLELDDPRRATEGARTRLRELIYSGDLPAGMTISQVALSEALGVSRTPLREAIRMLQEEGLIEAEPNRRCRIAGFNAADVDATYGSRIVLEALGMRLTLPALDDAALAAARSALDDMEADDHPGVAATWHEAHQKFHRVFTNRAPAQLKAQLAAGTERAERYVRQLAHDVPSGWTHGRDEHRRILELATARRTDEAIAASCQHFARTAITLLAHVAAEFEPVATRTALNSVLRGLETQTGSPETTRLRPLAPLRT